MEYLWLSQFGEKNAKIVSFMKTFKKIDQKH